MKLLVAAIRAGDVERLDQLLEALPGVDLRGETGSALLREAADTGRPELVNSLLWAGADLYRAWPDGVDAVGWFADHGAWNMLLTVLPQPGSSFHQPSVPESSLRAALDLARSWLTVDPEQELRRRLNAPDTPATLVQRDQVFAWHDGGSTVVRIRVRTTGGRQGQVWVAHRAVVTLLEAHLGIVTSNDELADRAVHTADPDSWDNSQVHATITQRAERDAGVFDWLAARLTHPAAAHRLLAAQILHGLSFDERPFDAPAADILADRVRDEPDPAVLDSLIGALAEYALRARPGTDLPEILPHARHHDASVRARVAAELVVATGSRRNSLLRGQAHPPVPAVITTLIELAADPDADARTAALQVLADSYLDTVQLHAVFAEHLSDPHPPARMAAAVGLAFRNDPRGRETLHRLEADPATADTARRHLADLDRLAGRLSHPELAP
ncbi:hypothetical protein [Dactylosporangium vinaceum]|uniref:HEAT repeat domain-containing protein n=2 Tax=Dactylosporangium vinaceum TaxID=53362 RepID=A0ABV5M8W8_9ACTN